MSIENISVEILAEQHLEDAARVLAKNFMASNPVWKHYALPYDDILVIMRGKLLKALETDQSFVLLIYKKGPFRRWQVDWSHSSFGHFGLCNISSHA